MSTTNSEMKKHGISFVSSMSTLADDREPVESLLVECREMIGSIFSIPHTRRGHFKITMEMVTDPVPPCTVPTNSEGEE